MTSHTDKPVLPDPEPTPDPPPKPDSDLMASDLQAENAGLQASEDMIHSIANSVTHQSDMQTGADTSNYLWLQGIYAGGERTASATDYNNELRTDAALAYIQNELDLNNGYSYNDIEGTYYSLYACWN